MSQKFVIQGPIKGFDEAKAYASQPEGTSPVVLNVMLLDPTSGRFRPAQRQGDGMYDTFNFATGQTINAGTIVISASGGTADDGQAINLPVLNGSCSTIDNGTNNLIDVMIGTSSQTINVPGSACSSTTIRIGSQPNQGGGTGGLVTVTYPGGGTFQIPITQGGGATDPPITDPDRPYMRIGFCPANSGSLTQTYIHQDVLGFYNALPAMYDNNSASATYHMCLTVTGQRATADEISGLGSASTSTGIRLASDFTISPDCSSCTGGTDKYCYWVFRQYFWCDTLSWSKSSTASGVSGVSQIGSGTCLLPTQVPDGEFNTWKANGTTSSGSNVIKIYEQYVGGVTACVASGTCAATSPITPTPQTADPGTCHPLNLIISIYTVDGDDLVFTAIVPFIPDASGHCMTPGDTSVPYYQSPAPITNELTRGGNLSWCDYGSTVDGYTAANFVTAQTNPVFVDGDGIYYKPNNDKYTTALGRYEEIGVLGDPDYIPQYYMLVTTP